MKLMIEIPNEFVPHFKADRFYESLSRVLYDLKSIKGNCLSGLYERETVGMLRNAFDEAKFVSHNEVNKHDCNL